MKKLILLVGLAILMAFSANAQTYGSVTNLTGTNWAQVLTSPGVFQTNFVFQAGAYKTITIGNIANTNEVVQGWYAVNPTNGLTPAPGYPGYFIVGSFSNSFAAGTNGGSWSTTFNGTGQTVSCPVVLGIGISPAATTNSVYVP